MIKVLTPGFHARSDMKAPLKFALVAIAVNLILNLILIWPLAHIGPPLATAIASWVNVILLYLALRKRGHFEMDAQARQPHRPARARGPADGGGAGRDQPAGPAAARRQFRARVTGLALLVGGGFIVYAVAVFLTRAYSLAELKAFLRRKPREAKD